jgi:Bacterial regulatory helix-turn-helix protein, lysR family
MFSRVLFIFLTGSMHRLPPLNALRVFEVAARTGSYAEAGAELGLTHGAVSRQIAALETWLGHRLFVRSGRRMTATPAARAFAAEVSLSFDRMIAAGRFGKIVFQSRLDLDDIPFIVPANDNLRTKDSLPARCGSLLRRLTALRGRWLD